MGFAQGSAWRTHRISYTLRTCCLLLHTTKRDEKSREIVLDLGFLASSTQFLRPHTLILDALNLLAAPYFLFCLHDFRVTRDSNSCSKCALYMEWATQPSKFPSVRPHIRICVIQMINTPNLIGRVACHVRMFEERQLGQKKAPGCGDEATQSVSQRGYVLNMMFFCSCAYLGQKTAHG